jgi:glutaredoxin
MTCRRLKAWLSQNCVAFEERIVNEDPSLVEEFKALGYHTLPTAVIDGVAVAGFHHQWSTCIKQVKELLRFEDEEDYE